MIVNFNEKTVSRLSSWSLLTGKNVSPRIYRHLWTTDFHFLKRHNNDMIDDRLGAKFTISLEGKRLAVTISHLRKNAAVTIKFPNSSIIFQEP